MFRTQYDRKRVNCMPGSRIHKTYGGHYDEKGRVVLDEIGQIDTYAEIQSHRDSVDIHVLMKRYANGDVEALSQRQGFFGDVLDFPKTYAEALNHMNEMEKQFLSLPLEIRERFGHSFTEFLASSDQPDFLEKIGLQSKPADKEVQNVEKKEEASE